MKEIFKDDSWKAVFEQLCLSSDRIVGYCAVCGSKKSPPFEPQMCYLCSGCEKAHPFVDAAMVPCSEFQKKKAVLSEDDIVALTGLGPFRTRIEKFVGFNASAIITVRLFSFVVTVFRSHRTQSVS